ncbi:hypothetical protein DFJ73DRAFT_781510 [Zopfochytrium polystomum]|nr:hypothetical protein DFJ73DRAFT_781510 [Zopfochytrium polystomum]
MSLPDPLAISPLAPSVLPLVVPEDARDGSNATAQAAGSSVVTVNAVTIPAAPAVPPASFNPAAAFIDSLSPEAFTMFVAAIGRTPYHAPPTPSTADAAASLALLSNLLDKKVTTSEVSALAAALTPAATPAHTMAATPDETKISPSRSDDRPPSGTNMSYVDNLLEWDPAQPDDSDSKGLLHLLLLLVLALVLLLTLASPTTVVAPLMVATLTVTTHLEILLAYRPLVSSGWIHICPAATVCFGYARISTVIMTDVMTPATLMLPVLSTLVVMTDVPVPPIATGPRSSATAVSNLDISYDYESRSNSGNQQYTLYQLDL